MVQRSSTLRLLSALITSALLAASPTALRAQAHPNWGGNYCTSYCWVNSCPYYGWIEVVAPWDGGPLANSKLPVTNYCYLGVCDVGNGCTQSMANRSLVPRILAAVAGGNIGELETIVVTHPRSVVVNVARHAIQVTGCSEQQLVASIPVPPVELAALSRALGSPGSDLAAISEDGNSVVALRPGNWH